MIESNDYRFEKLRGMVEKDGMLTGYEYHALLDFLRELQEMIKRKEIS